MVNLVIDIGNTFTKIALFNNRRLVKHEVVNHPDIETISTFISDTTIEHAILSSVETEATELERFLKSIAHYQRFTATLHLGIKNHYKTPQTLGLDRLAGVVGAKSLFPGTHILVIDAGTCITFDFIDKDDNYWGGSIAPGLAMRLRAMHTLTGRLPLIESDPDFSEEYGLDTRSAILSGAQNGAYFEALGFIQYYYSKYPGLQIILCGGDSNFFDTRLKNSIFANSVKTEPYLVLKGLNEVIHQQAND